MELEGSGIVIDGIRIVLLISIDISYVIEDRAYFNALLPHNLSFDLDALEIMF
jgi:hypothetical protein